MSRKCENSSKKLIYVIKWTDLERKSNYKVKIMEFKNIRTKIIDGKTTRTIFTIYPIF